MSTAHVGGSLQPTRICPYCKTPVDADAMECPACERSFTPRPERWNPAGHIAGIACIGAFAAFVSSRDASAAPVILSVASAVLAPWLLYVIVRSAVRAAIRDARE